MPFLSSTCTYAIRACLLVAAAKPAAGEFVSTRRIAQELDVPFPFLTKVLLGLTKNGILVSQRGAAGGVSLAHPAKAITLLDVVVSVGGETIFRDCVLGLSRCSDRSPCALHHAWQEQRSRMEALFRNTSLAELAMAAPAGSATRRRRTSQRRSS